jgi:tetratricopeptide (TPR) repeat protein
VKFEAEKQDRHRRSSLAPMKQRNIASVALRISAAAVILQIVYPLPSAAAQSTTPAPTTQTSQQVESAPATPEAELQTGISLTRQGHFRDAIPHFLAAKGHVTEDYAENFNLALCYVATAQPKPAIELLQPLAAGTQNPAAVNNLLAQAYVADDQPEKAFDAVQHAAALTPQNEKLYLFVLDACMDHKSYDLGVKVAGLGLQNLPRSSPLLYQRALFLTNLDRYDLAKVDFDHARDFTPESDIAYMATVQENLFEGNIPAAVYAARKGVEKFADNYILLQLLGESLIHSGVNPGQPEFNEARSALEKSVALHPNYSRSQIALGKLYLVENRTDDAIARLQFARQLEPANTAIYSHLATAYRRKGDSQEAQQMLAILANLNDAQAAKIRSGPPGKAGTAPPPGVQ